MKRPRIKEGDIVSIVLPNGRYGFGRALRSPDFAFYELTADTDLPITRIISSRVLFRVSVMKRAVGRWRVIGNAPLEDVLKLPARYFRQDALSGEIYLFTSDGEMWEELPVSEEACHGLERLAVWEPEHVESRLEDHFAGRQNKWVESLRLKPKGQ